MDYSRRSLLTLVFSALAAGLSGCASVPDVTVSYRPIEWTVGVTVVQTLGCLSGDTPEPFVESTVSVSPRYFAGAPDSRFQVRIKDLDVWFADSDLTVAYTEDGRLKGINTSSTGQGEAIVKGIVGVAAAFGGIKIQTTGATPLAAKSICEVLVEEGFGAKPVTLKYRVRVDKSRLGKTVDFEPAVESEGLHQRLQRAEKYPQLTLRVGQTTQFDDRVTVTPKALADGVIKLPMQMIATLSLVTEAKQADVDAPLILDQSAVAVPLDERFELPIPKPALFGKQSFSLSLAESGRIVSIGYGKTAGAAGALGAGTSLAGAETQASNFEVAALKAEADLIAQQQRLISCRLDQTTCK